jgi:hypothetical protein
MSATRARRIRRAAIGALVLAALTVASFAAARADTISTTVEVRGTNGTGPDTVYAGDIISNQKCVGERTVDLVGVFGTEKQVIDTFRTSDNGAWVLGGDSSAANDLLVKARKKRIGPPHHRKLCAADSAAVAF